MAEVKVNLSGDARSLTAALREATKGLKSLKSSATELNQALELVKKAFSSISNAASKFTDALDLGGQLSDLSAATGQSVRDLVLLRQALQNAGLGADSVITVTARLQKALSNINATMLENKEAFEALGVSAASLTDLSTIEQIDALARAFDRIGSAAERSAIAQRIFGRAGAQVLTLFKEVDPIARAEREVGGLADTMERSADVFDRISDSLTTIGQKFTEFAAGALSQIAPTLKDITVALAEIDLTGIGEAIGGVVKRVIELSDSLLVVARNIPFVGAAFKILSSSSPDIEKLVSANERLKSQFEAQAKQVENKEAQLELQERINASIKEQSDLLASASKDDSLSKSSVYLDALKGNVKGLEVMLASAKALTEEDFKRATALREQKQLEGEIADKAVEVRRTIVSEEEKLSEKIKKSELEQLGLAEQRKRLLDEVKTSNELNLDYELLALKEKKALNDEEVIRYASLLSVKGELLDLSKKEQAEQKAIAKAIADSKKKSVEKLTALRGENAMLATKLEAGSDIAAMELEIASTKEKAIAATGKEREELFKQLALQQMLLNAKRDQLKTDSDSAALAKSREAIEHDLTLLEDERSRISARFDSLRSSAFITERESMNLRLDQLAEEQRFLERSVSVMKARAEELKGNSNENAVLEFESLRGRIAQTEALISANRRLLAEQQQLSSFAGQLKASMIDAFDSAALSAKNAAGIVTTTLGSAVSGLAQSFTDALFTVKSFGEGMQVVARQVVMDLVRMTTEALIYKAIMGSIGVGTGGASSIFGGILGFDSGGMVPGAPSSRDNRIAKVATGEYIVRASSVQHYGSALFEALNNMRLPRMSLAGLPLPRPSRAPGFATGGFVGGFDNGSSSGGGNQNVNIAVLNTRQDMKSYMRKEGKKYVVDIVRGTSWELGGRA